MPYLLLVIGLLIGLFTLYRFFINANVHQIKALFLTAAFVIFGLSLFFLAITGRLPAAIALIAAVIPLAIGYLRQKYTKDKNVIDVEPIEDDEKKD